MLSYAKHVIDLQSLSLTYVCIGAKRIKKNKKYIDPLIWIRWEVHLAQVTDSGGNIGSAAALGPLV